MKKFLAIMILSLLSSNVVFADDFCVGFKKGYISGYKKSSNDIGCKMSDAAKSCTGPSDLFVPSCPSKLFRNKSSSDPQSDYEYGYVTGYDQGIDAN